MSFLDKINSDSKTSDVCKMRYTLSNTVATFGVRIFPDNCKNAGRMKICFMAGPARIDFILILTTWHVLTRTRLWLCLTDHSMNIQPWLLIHTRYVLVRGDTNYLQKNIYVTRIRYTRYRRPGTTYHPHYLGTGLTFFLQRPQHLKKTWFSTICPPPSISTSLLRVV